MDILKNIDGWAITGKMATLMHLRNIGERGYRVPREVTIAVRKRHLNKIINLLISDGFNQIDELKFRKDRLYIIIIINGFPNLNENTIVMIDDYPVMKNVTCESNRHARAIRNMRRSQYCLENMQEEE
jgi:hypothetical protein